jgi:preprotein translocase subunit SecF
VRGVLEAGNFRDVSVQNYGTAQDVLIRLRLHQGESSAKTSEAVLALLKQQDPSVELRRVEFIGPQVGKELYESGGLALLLVIAGIMIYLAIRFEWRFAVAAIIANMHDVVIILGFFAFFQWEFSLSVLAGVLAVLGYSVNESVVVFDRIRENFRKMRKKTVPEIIDNAITATMSRTVITHTMTELVVLSMLFFGGEVLFYFALALTIGIVFGIYSSVLVASPIVLLLGVSRENLLPVKKEGADADLRS